MTPPRIDAVLLRWPDQVRYSAVGFLSIPGCPAMQVIVVGESPWQVFAAMFMQAVALDSARRLQALSFMEAPARN